MAGTHRTRFRILVLFALATMCAVATADDDDNALQWTQVSAQDPYVWYNVKWADHDAKHYVYVHVAMTTHPGNPSDVGIFGISDYVIYCARGGFVPIHTDGGVHWDESEYTAYADQPSGLIGRIAAVVCQQ